MQEVARKDGSVRKEDPCEGSPRAWSGGLKPQPGGTLHPSDGVTLGGLGHLGETRTPKWASDVDRRLKQHSLAFGHEGLDDKVEVSFWQRGRFDQVEPRVQLCPSHTDHI